MKILLILIFTFLLGSIATGCQDSDLSETEKIGNTSPTKPSVQGSEPVATTANSPAAGQNTCQISAYVADREQKGLKVYSRPDSRSEVIENLSTNTAGVMVDITASQGNWMQLTKAESPEKSLFQGSGWIDNQLLGLGTRGYESGGVSVYASASTESSVVGRIPADTGVELLGCQGAWVLVEDDGLKGWIASEDQCPSPFTTCP